MNRSRQAVAAETSKTRIGEMLQKRMDEEGLDIREFAAQLEMTYEYVRKILRGEALPSPSMLRQICQQLKINKEDAEKLVVADRIQIKYGKMPALLANKNPELDPLERIWGKLSEDHKKDLISQAQAWAKRDTK